MALNAYSSPELSKRIQFCVSSLVRDISDGRLPKIVVSKFRAKEGATEASDNTDNRSIYEVSDSEWILSVRNSGANPSRLVAFLAVLQIIQELLVQRKHATKRDVYYTNTSLFKDQFMVDRALIDIGVYFNCPRSELNVVSSSKGLVMGRLTYKESGQPVDCSQCTRTGIGIPSFLSHITDVSSSAKYVLVLEKETAFLRLADDGFCERNDAIILTGKGYPDVATRLFLRFLSEKLSIPLYGVTDGDPHGLDIMCTYRFGSLQMAHDAHNLATPLLQWLGVFPCDVEAFGIPSRCCLPLSRRDRSKGEALLRREHLRSLAPVWCQHLQEMLDFGWKLEIEALAAVGMTVLSDVYLPNKVGEQNLVCLPTSTQP